MPRYYRRIIRIKGTDSPNVRFAMAQIAAGIEPTDEMIVPGVLRWSDYKKRRATWDIVRQTIGLDGEFYKGAQLLLFPPDWLNRAEEVAAALGSGRQHRKAEAIGIDPAEGGDKTAMAAVDRFGIIELVSRRTPDTTMIAGETIAFGRSHGVDPVNWVFDAGGGGNIHAQALRKQGFKGVRAVAFGEKVALAIKRGIHPVEARRDVKEERYEYINLRAQMYGEFSELLDPSLNPQGFGIPTEYSIPPIEGACLRQQLAPIPRLYDNEGRMWLPSKGTVTDRMKEERIKTLIQIIGHSPDEADSVVLAIHGMLHKKRLIVAGAIG